MNLNRKQILKGNYIFPNNLIHLKQTHHVKQRIQERYSQFIIIPEYIRVTLDNIYSAKTEDEKHLHSVVVRLDYDRTKWLNICCNPFDSAFKSVWFTNKKGKNVYINK